ncbi:MAG: hypothetical protein IPM96_16790 [Ignavibacteria bacterium]|nr:hypothetical protein [Ignavibacteria bacterium]
MTTLLEKAVDRISKLPENEQDEIAKIILDEIEDEKVWYNKFRNSQNELSILADQALKNQ